LQEDVQSWLAARDVEPSGPVETIHERPWSTVLRVPTAGGDLYLKQEQPLQAYEIPLTVALASRWPDRVPEVVAADIDRSWLLLRDGGIRVADSGNLELFPRALALYGELQVGEVARVDELLGFGLRDLRLPVVVDLYESFFDRDQELEPGEVASGSSARSSRSWVCRRRSSTTTCTGGTCSSGTDGSRSTTGGTRASASRCGLG
jgi:hypothetical protein